MQGCAKPNSSMSQYDMIVSQYDIVSDSGPKVVRKNISWDLFKFKVSESESEVSSVTFRGIDTLIASSKNGSVSYHYCCYNN